MLANIKIVMVGTTHPGNIGAAARVMNNMCFSELALVDPKCPVGEIAYARASGAHTILDHRQTFESLSEAIADCQYVVATSARDRSLTWPTLHPQQLAKTLHQSKKGQQIALVFGREHSGLTNQEIQLCNAMVCIPTNPDFSSLNIAAAIQVICYEVFSQLTRSSPDVSNSDISDPKVSNSGKSSTETSSPDKSDPAESIATSQEVEAYFTHLEQTLESIEFINPQKPGQIMQRLRRLYLRSELSQREINILRGILTATSQSD